MATTQASARPQFLVLTVSEIEASPRDHEETAAVTATCMAFSLDGVELARSALGGTVSLALTEDSRAAQIAVSGPAGFLGSVSLSLSELATCCAKEQHKHWMTLFENKKDDVYDGNYAEDDTELPRILVSYRLEAAVPDDRQSIATSAATNYVSGPAPDSLETTHVERPIAVVPVAADLTNPAFYDSLSPPPQSQILVEKLRKDLRDRDVQLSTLTAEKAALAAKLASLETAAARAEEASRRAKLQHETEKNILSQQAMLRFSQYEARIKSLISLLDNFKKIPAAAISFAPAPDLREEIEALNSRHRAELAAAEKSLAEQQRAFEARTAAWKSERQELQLKHTRKLSAEAKEKGEKISELEKRVIEYKALQDRLRERVKMLESCCNALRRDRDQRNSSHHDQHKPRHRHHDMLAVAVDLNRDSNGTAPVSSNENRSEEGSSDSSSGNRTLHKSATTARLIHPVSRPSEPATSRHRYIRKDEPLQNSSCDSLEPASTYEQLQRVLRQKVGEICHTERESRMHKSGSGVLKTVRDYSNGTESQYTPERGDQVDQMLAYHLNMRRCSVNIKRMSEGHYMFGTRRITAKIQNERLVVRVGGGYMLLEDFLNEYTPQDSDRNKSNDLGLSPVVPTKKITLDGDWENLRCLPFEPSPSSRNTRILKRERDRTAGKSVEQVKIAGGTDKRDDEAEGAERAGAGKYRRNTQGRWEDRPAERRQDCRQEGQCYHPERDKALV